MTHQQNSLSSARDFFNYEDINLADNKGRDRSMQTVLGIEKTNKYQVIKQPDILMLLYLMRDNEKALQANWDYYAPRTDITYS